MIQLLVLAGLLAPPPQWRALSAPGIFNTDRVVFSPDGERIGLCAEERAVIVDVARGQSRLLDRPCAGLAFSADAVYVAVRYPTKGQSGLARFGARITALPAGPTRDLAWVQDRLLSAAPEAIVAWQDDKPVARVPIPAVRRLVARAAGVLAVAPKAVHVLDAALKPLRVLTPDPAPSLNGLYDAIELPDGSMIAIDNAGSLWRWGADGRQTAYHFTAVAGRALAFTGTHLVVGEFWVDPTRLEIVHREERIARADGPVAVSPDGRLIAHPAHDSVILRPARPSPHPVRGLPAGGRGMVASKDGIVVGDDGGALVWFDGKGRVVRRRVVARAGLRDLVGDPATALYATSEWGDVIVVRPGQPVRRWPAPISESLRLSKDGHTLLVGGQRHAYRFDTRTGARTTLVETEDHHTFRPIFAPDGSVLVFGDDLPTRWWKRDGTVVDWPKGRSGSVDRKGRLWVVGRETSGIRRWPAGTFIKRFERFWSPHHIPLPDGGVIAHGWDGLVSRRGAQGEERWRDHGPWHVGGAALRGSTLLTSGPDLTISAWDIATGKRTAWAPPGRGEAVTGLVFSADGARLAVAYDYGGLRVWDRKTHTMVRELSLKDVADVSVSRDGATWIARTANALHSWPAGAKAATRRPLLPDGYGGIPRETVHNGRYLFVPESPKGRVIDQRTGKTVWRPQVPEPLQQVAVSTDGRRVTMLSGRQLTVQTRGGAPRPGPKGEWDAVAWRGDALWVIGDSAVFEWRPGARRRRIERSIGMFPPVTGGSRVAFSNGRIVSVFEGDRRVATLPLEAGGEREIALSPDGRWLAVGGRFSGSVLLWDVNAQIAVARYEAFGDGLWRSTTAKGEQSGPTFARKWR